MILAKPRKIFIIFIILAILSIIPLYLKGYSIRLLTNIFLFIALSQSWNIMSGYTGYISFGHVAFFGIGGYTTAILMIYLHLNFYFSFFLGGLISTLFAVLIGIPLLRVKGHYFAVATFGVAEVTQVISSNLKITGGGGGLTLPMLAGPPKTVFIFFYFVMFAIAVTVTLIIWLINNSILGYGFKSIREGEDAASCLGVNTTLYKVYALAISAFFTGLAGGIYAYWIVYIDPPSLFSVHISIAMVIMTLLGGAGTILGPVIGAVLITTISELLWTKFLQFHFLLFGIIVILVVIFMPKGFMDLYRQGWKSLSLSQIMANLKRYKAD